jgi:hypothetical protein
MMKTKLRPVVIGQVVGIGEVVLVVGMVQTEGVLEVEVTEEALEVEMVQTGGVLEVEADPTEVDLEAEVVQTEGALEVEGTEEALVVEAEEGGIKMVVGVTTILLKIRPLTGRMGQTIAVEDGKIMVVEAVGTEEVVIGATNRIAGILEVVEQAMKVVVGVAKVQAGTSQERPKIVVAVTLLVVGTREPVQTAMLPGVKETAGSHQILLVRAGVNQAKKLKVQKIKGVAGTKDLLVQTAMLPGVKETAGSHQILLVRAGVNQAKKLKVRKIKGVAGTKDLVPVLKVVAGGQKEQAQEKQG